MTGKQLETLLWQEIDGRLSEEDRRLLEERLAADAEARATRKRLSAFSSRLSALELVEPPEELGSDIRRALAARASRPAMSGRARGLAGTHGLYRFGWLAAGIAVGAVLALLASRGFGTPAGLEPGDLYGTVALRADEGIDLGLDEEVGSLRLRREGRKLTLWIRVREPLEVELTRPAGGLRLERVSEAAPGLREMRVSEREIEIATGLEGGAVIELWIDQLGGEPVNLAVTASGRRAFERRIDLDGSGS